TDYRAAAGGTEARSVMTRVREHLRERGVAWSHSVGATLATRVLRPGSSAATDALVIDVHDRWTRLETLLGFEVDARVAAFTLRNEVDVERAAGLAPPANAEAWRFSQIYGLLWPRGYEARSATLSAYSPFSWLGDPDRLIAAPLLSEQRRCVN